LAVALDAQTRGLKTAMVEADDFAAGYASHVEKTSTMHGRPEEMKRLCDKIL
jgi:glycerol-3-phosphate dehydrogenase